MDLSKKELNWEALERLVTQTFLSPVSLSTVIHNAGVLEPTGPLSQVIEIEKAFQVNVFSMISLWQWSVAFLRETQGRFIAVSSGAATRAYESLGVYCSSKAAMNMFIETMAKEEPTITCLALRPGNFVKYSSLGVVETEMQVFLREHGPEFGMNRQDFEKFKSLYENGQVIPARQAGEFLAKVAIHCPLHLSGQFLSWDDPQWQHV
jgi:NAD(P)-dependent dehydrogenase (short-subunit alcohol dehydrogenase family)